MPNKFVNQYLDPRILEVGGPLLPCQWGVPRVLEQHLRAAGRSVPPLVEGYLLLDTGASRTCISQRAVQELGLSPLRLQQSYGAGGLHVSEVYRVRMYLRLANAAAFTDLEWESEAQVIPHLEESVEPLKLVHEGVPVRLVGLLGRDILRHTKILYDGISGRLEINFDLQSISQISRNSKAP